MPRNFIANTNTSTDTVVITCPGCKKSKHPRSYKKRNCISDGIIGYTRDTICQNCPSKKPKETKTKRPSLCELNNQIVALQAENAAIKCNVKDMVHKMSTSISSLLGRISVLEGTAIQQGSPPLKSELTLESVDPMSDICVDD